MKILVYTLVLCIPIINSGCSQAQPKELDDFEILNIERAADQTISVVQLSFNYKKGIKAMDFVYLTFAEFKSCTSDNIISSRSRIVENLSLQDEKIVYTLNLDVYGIKAFDYARLKISDIEGEYSNDSEIGDRQEYYSKCK